MKILTGTTYLINEPRSMHLAGQIIIHPKFTGMTEETRYSYDIAVVVVEGVIKLNDLQNIVKLPSKNIRHGDIGMLAGWGYTIYPSSTSSNRLQKVEMNVYDTYQCRILVPFNLKIDQFCGYKRMGIGACIGDSGGPLVVDNVVIGISSLTIPCAQGVPDVYTNVKYHTDFITAALQI
ncbi:PREDICTED: chymotrypsin-2-like [Ceratosolen solmsi marchali]|uniref:Chymotrypsin-2-like n=1 Tax=Ceratosolen solmsi marchali TaxID=326594 RepID=A0AAJ6YSG6_9HYME|nr:PREDICTED: chymotrypsin-2-like [Ceratosolen solmsi marchali]